MKYIITFLFIIILNVCNAETYQANYPNGQQHYLFYKKHNNLHGKYTYWHANGNKAVEGKFKKGKREGLWQAWYENGNLCYERNFVNGEENGNTKYYYENGQLQASGPYKKNLREGHWEIWNKDGDLRGEGECNEDNFDGQWRFYVGSDSVFFNNYINGEFQKDSICDDFRTDILRAKCYSRISVTQEFNGEFRFIFRSDFEGVFVVENDYNLICQRNGLFHFHESTIIDFGYNNIKKYVITSLYGGYLNGLKDGKFIQHSIEKINGELKKSYLEKHFKCNDIISNKLEESIARDSTSFYSYYKKRHQAKVTYKNNYDKIVLLSEKQIESDSITDYYKQDYTILIGDQSSCNGLCNLLLPKKNIIWMNDWNNPKIKKILSPDLFLSQFEKTNLQNTNSTYIIDSMSLQKDKRYMNYSWQLHSKSLKNDSSVYLVGETSGLKHFIDITRMLYGYQLENTVDIFNTNYDSIVIRKIGDNNFQFLCFRDSIKSEINLVINPLYNNLDLLYSPIIINNGIFDDFAVYRQFKNIDKMLLHGYYIFYNKEGEIDSFYLFDYGFLKEYKKL